MREYHRMNSEKILLAHRTGKYSLKHFPNLWKYDGFFCASRLICNDNIWPILRQHEYFNTLAPRLQQNISTQFGCCYLTPVILSFHRCFNFYWRVKIDSAKSLGTEKSPYPKTGLFCIGAVQIPPGRRFYLNQIKVEQSFYNTLLHLVGSVPTDCP